MPRSWGASDMACAVPGAAKRRNDAPTRLPLGRAGREFGGTVLLFGFRGTENFLKPRIGLGRRGGLFHPGRGNLRVDCERPERSFDQARQPASRRTRPIPLLYMLYVCAGRPHLPGATGGRRWPDRPSSSRLDSGDSYVRSRGENSYARPLPCSSCNTAAMGRIGRQFLTSCLPASLIIASPFRGVQAATAGLDGALRVL